MEYLNNFEYILKKNVVYWVCRNKKSAMCHANAQTITIDGQQFVKKAKVSTIIQIKS